MSAIKTNKRFWLNQKFNQLFDDVFNNTIFFRRTFFHHRLSFGCHFTKLRAHVAVYHCEIPGQEP